IRHTNYLSRLANARTHRSEVAGGPHIATFGRLPANSSSFGGRRLLRRNQRLDAINDGADGFKRLDFFVGVVGDLDAETIFDVEYDHRKIKRLDLEISKLGVERDIVARLLHMLLEDIDNLRRDFVHWPLPPSQITAMGQFCLASTKSRPLHQQAGGSLIL